MNWTRIRSGFAPWSGLALGTIGYFLAHQIGSDSTFQDCNLGSPLGVIVGTLVGLAIIAIGAFVSWNIHAASRETPARRLLAVVGLLACTLFAIGAVLSVIASLIIPRCWA